MSGGAWRVALLAVVVAIAQGPAWWAPSYDDDWRHRWAMDRVIAGDRSLVDWAVARHNDHVIPLWKIWAYGVYAKFRWSPLAFHLGNSTLHFVGALGLVAVLRSALGATRAWTAGVLWAGATLGNFDAPHVWVSASHATIGMAFWLLASACAIGANARWWVASLGGFVVCWSAALATMLPLAALTPALCWLIVSRTPGGMRCWLYMIAAVAIAAAAGVAQLLLPNDPTDARRAGPRSALVAGEATGLLHAASLGHLVLPPVIVRLDAVDHAWQANVGSPIAAALGALVAIILAFGRRRIDKPASFAVAWALIASVSWCGLAAYQMSDGAVWELAARGRYRLPATFFCVVALAAYAPLPRGGWRIALTVLFLGLQSANSAAAARQLSVMHAANYPGAAMLFGFRD